ncbi:MAG: DegV family protein [Tissierellia bacterium]|nr:DegV family protein [Tissierellia bacterium]
MNAQKIAILTDSGCDVPSHLIEKYGIYVLPLRIVYKDGEYLDRVDITAEEVYDNLDREIPSTSLPSGGDIHNMLDRIKSDGYEKVLAVCISSGLSGTYNNIRLMANDYDGLEVFVLDTKNIAIASGFSAIQAAEYIEDGMDWDTLIKTVSRDIDKSKVFFYVDTLEYLKKGGRIGLVASMLGSALNLKPIISCNEDGIYYTVSKMLGKRRALNRAIDLARRFATTGRNYNIAVVHGRAESEANRIKDIILPLLPDYNILVDGQISPALGVHTGPGAIGIAIQLIP